MGTGYLRECTMNCLRDPETTPYVLTVLALSPAHAIEIALRNGYRPLDMIFRDYGVVKG